MGVHDGMYFIQGGYSMTKNVTTSESFRITEKKVPKFVIGRHPELVLADGEGHRANLAEWKEGCGFLLKSTKPNCGFWRTLFGPANKFIGRLYFYNKTKGATIKNWMFEVYGRQHIELATKIAKNLSEEFNVDIHVRLDSEEIRYQIRGCYGDM
jgi:hypothetical protein